MFKLLLKYYQDYEGDIFLGTQNLKWISPDDWRRKCGVVMQEGMIFDGSIAKNIALGFHEIDKEQLYKVSKIANCMSFIDEFPNGFNTIIGGNLGVQLSGGEKQRILIARALFRDPEFIFFDEASSALDSINEKEVLDNLNTYVKDKTLIVIAHRLSTVKNAHQIVVLNQGEIVEIGNHNTLIEKKGHYFNLVKNQLELGS